MEIQVSLCQENNSFSKKVGFVSWLYQLLQLVQTKLKILFVRIKIFLNIWCFKISIITLKCPWFKWGWHQTSKL